MRWFFPSFSGDFRLEADGSGSKLIIDSPTLAERQMLEKFFKAALKKDWPTNKVILEFAAGEHQELRLSANVATAGKLLLKFARPERSGITAVKYVDGKLAVAQGGDEEAIEKVLEGKASAAVSVSRPTPSCPDCIPGSVEMASEVLLSFLTPTEHEAWAKSRQIIVTGHLSGHRYLLSHRHHPRAVKDTRMCFDLDSDVILKFHDWSVPPEEELLAAKLILEHREPWLRNEATLAHALHRYSSEPVFKNPFGNLQDGVPDAALTATLGMWGQALSSEEL